MTQKNLCLYFQIHQPTRLRLYRFFDIGKDSHYYDDFTNRTILKRVADLCYLPMNKLLLELINQHKGAFKVAFSISGSALEQFERYAPEVIDSFRKLADTGCAEFLCETYYHSLASLASEPEFKHQVLKHKAAIEHYFGVTPVTFRNTELIYSDTIGAQVYDMGFHTMLTEGAKHILAWRSPDFVYSDDRQNRLKLLLRNYSLSDDIAFRFSDRSWAEWPLTAEKYLGWLKNDINTSAGDVINLFMDYETFGEHQNAASVLLQKSQKLASQCLHSKFRSLFHGQTRSAMSRHGSETNSSRRPTTSFTPSMRSSLLSMTLHSTMISAICRRATTSIICAQNSSQTEKSTNISTLTTPLLLNLQLLKIRKLRKRSRQKKRNQLKTRRLRRP